MRFVAQESVNLHHGLRSQLAQHLEEYGLLERAVHAGSLEKGVRFKDPGRPTGRQRVAAVPLPHLVLGLLICKARAL